MEKEGMNKTVVLKSILWLCLGIIFILPVFLIIMNAFKPNNDILTSFISFPKSLYLENFSEAMRIMNFWTVFRNTLFVTVCTVIVASAVSFMSAYGISHLPQKKGDKLYTLFVVGQIIPFHAVMIPISVLATNTNLTNSLGGIIILDIGFFCAFGILTFTGFLKNVPRELEEAAAIDGCGVFRIMTQIVFPLVKPATVTIGVLFFMWSWNDFLLPSILIGDSELRPLTVNLFMFRSATSTQWNLFIAGLTLCIIPTIILYICAQKYITSGLTMGAVK